MDRKWMGRMRGGNSNGRGGDGGEKTGKRSGEGK